MKLFSLLTIVVLLFGVIAVDAQDGKTNFSGKWTLNADKSDQGGGGGRGGRGGGRGMGASKMVIEHDGDKLIVETFRKNRDGDEISTKVTYSLDGKKVKSENDRGSSVSVAKWGKDGKTVTIISERTMGRGGQNFTMETSQIWSMKSNILIIDSVMSSQRGDRESKAVYDKAK
jgi:hypothetical protein